MEGELPSEDPTEISIDETDDQEMSSTPHLSSPRTSRAKYKTRPADRIVKAAVVADIIRGSTIRDAAMAHHLAPATVSHWRGHDEEFREMLDQAEDEVITALRKEATESALNDIRELMPDASRVLANAINGEDKRLAMQAATIILRYSVADAQSPTQLESMLRTIDARPTDGD